MGRNRLGLAPTCVKGLPSDATFIGSYSDDARAQGYLIFHHSSFDQVPASEELPEFVPQFRSDNYIAPFDGLRIEFVSAGQVIIHRQHDLVQAQWVRPSPMDTFETDDGHQFHVPIKAVEDQIIFDSADVSLQDRVRFVRDINRPASGKTPQT